MGWEAIFQAVPCRCDSTPHRYVLEGGKRPLTLQLVRPAAAAAGKGKEPWAAAPPRAGRAPLTVAVPGSDDDDAIPAPFLTPGDRVEARFQGSAEYFPGVLTAARPGYCLLGSLVN